jgi:hypothetical protein
MLCVISVAAPGNPVSAKQTKGSGRNAKEFQVRISKAVDRRSSTM